MFVYLLVKICVIIFLTIYFEITIDSQELGKITIKKSE